MGEGGQDGRRERVEERKECKTMIFRLVWLLTVFNSYTQSKRLEYNYKSCVCFISVNCSHCLTKIRSQ